MKNYLLSIGIIIAIFVQFSTVNAQSWTFTTIAGNGTFGPPNYFGPATSSPVAGSNTSIRIAADYSGNIYFGSYLGYAISRINTDGTISRVIGDGREYGTPDDTVYVDHLGVLMSMTCDRLGNLYFVDGMTGIRKLTPGSSWAETIEGTEGSNFVYADSLNNIYYGGYSSINKLTPSGTTTIIAGTGTAGYSGDGGLAIAAEIYYVSGMTIDASGNIYIIDQGNYRLRKINSSGIITTIAGTGVDGGSGDGGPANLAGINTYESAAFDNAGNLFLSVNGIPRMIDPSGIISSPPAIAYMDALCSDHYGNIICDTGGTFIRKISPAAVATSSNFSLYITRNCGGATINISTTLNDTSFQCVNYYGDGTVDTTAFHTGFFGAGSYTNSQHHYNMPGAYTIKNVLINGNTLIDSFTNTYTSQHCDELLIRSYLDNNNNCHYDSITDISGGFPISVAVDSNGIAIDTISLTGGSYYRAYGNVGDIYTFREITLPLGIVVSCPSSGIITDTLTMYSDNSKKLDLAFNCGSPSGFDINLNTSHNTGRHLQQFQIAIANNYCTATTVTVTANISTKYDYFSSSLTPTSIAGHVITWVIPNVSIATPSSPIMLYLRTPGSTSDWLLPGDTVHTAISAFPLSGDLDTTNNIKFFIDTVRSSFDPNYIAVTPQGNILNGTKLQYTIEFENDGNDTAQNIYVMDTLSDNVDPSSFEMVLATQAMNIATFQSGGHTIVKFDFPNIKLLDSTHHNQCTGMLIYNINAKKGLPDDTNIFNHAGIFFDDNPVVITNSVQNIIRIPSISITDSTSVCPGDTAYFIATTPNISNTHYRWSLNTATVGEDKFEFMSATLNTGDIISCQLWDGTGDSLLSISNNIYVNNLPLPNAGTITGIPTVCELATTSLTNTATGGTWSSSSTDATISGTVVTGVLAGSSIISYSVTNSCGTAIDTMMVTINPLPQAGTITGLTAVCATVSMTLTDTVSGGTWTSSSATATVAGGFVTGASAGTAIISYSVSNSCGTAVDTMMVTVLPLASAGTITGTPAVCELSTTTLSSIVTGGTWTSSSAVATVSGGALHGITVGSAIISYTVSNSCNVAVDTMMITVNPLPHVGAITGPTSVCVGTTITLTDTTSGGFWYAGSGDATAVGGSITGITPNNVNIYYSITNSCGTASDTLTVTVLPLADAGTITGSSSLCAGTNISLTDLATGGSWSTSTTGIATVNASGIVTGIAAGSATVTYIVTNTCGADTTTSNITVNPLPDAGTITGLDSVCIGGVIMLSNTATGTWSSTNTGIAVVSATGVVTCLSNGIVTIIYTSTNSCGTDTATHQVVVRTIGCEGSVGNAGSVGNNLSLYPNPNDGSFTVSGSLQSIGRDVNIEIVNMLGQVVYRNSFVNTSGNISEQIQTNGKLADGTYMLRVESGNVNANFHFVIKG